jgi:hypothetical protein
VTWLDSLYWSNHFWAAIAVFSAFLVLWSSLADRRRHRRTNIDDVGFVPWTAITILSVLSTVIAAAFVIKGG